MQEQSNNTMHYVVALLLGVVGLLIILIFVSIRSQADDTSTTATISNDPPSVTSLTISTSSLGPALDGSIFTPAENATRTLYAYGSYTDNNGCDEVSDPGANAGFSLNIRRNGMTTTTCQDPSSTDPLNCYVAAETVSSTAAGTGLNCVISNCSGGTDVSADFECTFPIHHFVDATDEASAYNAQKWRISYFIEDSNGGTADDLDSEFEIATLNAIDSGASVAYGALPLGGTSASDETLVITNTGNKDGQDINLSGNDMGCSDGQISVGQQKYATNTSVAYGSKVALTSSGVPAVMNVKKNVVSSTAATSNTYWMISIPSSGLSGSCSGTITVTAVAG